MDNKDKRLDLFIEALIFASQYALGTNEIKKVLNLTFGQNFTSKLVEENIQKIRDKYESEEFAIQLTPIAGGFQFMSKPFYHKVIGDLLRLNEKKKLSKASLETLSIVAYKQPITKNQVESIRGVNSDYTIQKLLLKELVEIIGRGEGPGRPLLYVTTSKFLDHFGLKSVKELPKLKEIELTENTIGSQ